MEKSRSRWRSNAQKILIVVSLLYLVNASIGTTIAIQDNLPSVTLFKSGLPALEDFLFGFGTALSPPLFLCIAVVVCIILAFQPERPGNIGITGLVILGVLYTIGAFAETITYRVLNPATFDLPKALVVIVEIVLPLAMIGLGGWVLMRRRQADLHQMGK
jgi:hypothetical protein